MDRTSRYGTDVRRQRTPCGFWHIREEIRAEPLPSFLELFAALQEEERERGIVPLMSAQPPRVIVQTLGLIRYASFVPLILRAVDGSTSAGLWTRVRCPTGRTPVNHDQPNRARGNRDRPGRAPVNRDRTGGFLQNSSQKRQNRFSCYYLKRGQQSIKKSKRQAIPGF